MGYARVPAMRTFSKAIYSKKTCLVTEKKPRSSTLLNVHPKKKFNNVLAFGVLRCPPCCQIPRKIATASSVTGPVPCQTSGDRVLAGLCYALSGKRFAGRDHDSTAGDENTKKKKKKVSMTGNFYFATYVKLLPVMWHN